MAISALTALVLLLGPPTVLAADGSRPQQATGGSDNRARGEEGESTGPALTEADLLHHAGATRATSPPKIDGLLDDPVWAEAGVLTGFVQSTPNENQPASERTEVRILYDDEAIYIGVFCHDREPDQIVATVLRRDQDHSTNDSFAVTLDTYHDHRNGYFFETNPLGAKFDAQISGEGGTSLIRRLRGADFNRNWDAVWRTASKVNEEGWTAEIAIPFWSLRFEADHLGAWGINFRRSIRRRSEQSYWAPVPRQYDATRLSLSGMMTGLQDLGRPRNLQLKPFGIGGMSQAGGAAAAAGSLAHGSDLLKDGGLDVKWGMTPNLTVDLTANTDFSQVEADDEQINLTRFSLFFPEKREFFLENAGLFNFGSGGGGGGGFGGGSGRVIGFHSRRIGISESNEEVPLYGGGRLTGKVGPWSLGLVSLQSEKSGDLPSNNFSVVRIRRDLARRSNVGVLFTNRQGRGGDSNRELGFDGRWAVNSRTTIDAWWMKTSTPGLEGADWAGQTRFDWGTPLWQVEGGVQEIAENFNPELGFVNRTGIRTYNSTVHWTPYLNSWIRNLSPHVSFIYTTDTDSRLLSRFLHFDWDMFLPRGDKLSVAHNRHFEQLDRPFEISDGVVIPPGAYHYDELNFELQADPSRTLFGGLNYTIGTYWTGRRQVWRVNGGVRSGARFALNVSLNRNDVSLPQGDFTTDLIRARLSLDLSPRLSVAGLIQYNSQIDQVLSNIRVDFIHTPGADLFIVYNERRLAESTGLIDRAVIVKMTHLLRF